jgi:uncharacterized protein (TIGR00288 family)
MSQSSERNLALFIDFDNVALGARDSRMRFDVRLLMQRVLEKGKVVVKRAYADWHYYKEHMKPLHEAAIELIEVPSPKIGGKNSADIRLVVDAIDLCYSKSHIDTFVIVSGDSDFSPLVSKLRENDKGVIGIGVRSSSSHLLIGNCDEFVFYDDIYHSAVNKVSEKVSSVPHDKRELFDFLLQTSQSLLQESRGVLYSSLVKDTMKRKQPEFNEANYGYSTFGDLLEDARDRGLLEVERDSRAGGTLVVLGLGKGEPAAEARTGKSRRRRRDRSRPREDHDEQPAAESTAGHETAKSTSPDSVPAGDATGEAAAATGQTGATTSRRTTKKSSRRSTKKKKAVQDEKKAAAAGSAEATAEKPAEKVAKKTAKKAVKKTAKKTAKKTTKKTTKKTAKKTGSGGGNTAGG